MAKSTNKELSEISATSPYQIDIKKHWGGLKGKSLEFFTDYIIYINNGELIDGIIYYKKKLTHRQQGKITGYADCLSHVDYLIRDDIDTSKRN